MIIDAILVISYALVILVIYQYVKALYLLLGEESKELVIMEFFFG
jgi:hypothetical protein